MKISLIICTYQRPKSVSELLESIQKQVLMPSEILIIDSSLDHRTRDNIRQIKFSNLPIFYFLVNKENRGLTKQRNYGISKINKDTDIICFLDDDIVLEPNYFEELIKTYKLYPDAIGVGGIDLKENTFFKKEKNVDYNLFSYFEIDDWVKKESLRNKVRSVFGLMSNLQPDLIPEFSHGRSGLPPNGKIYKVEHFMGGIASYKNEIFNWISFSNYFEGYGLYEDFDFCVRSLKYGNLYVNTNAKVWHYHDEAGRPNKFKYGKMVVRNGWYVWRLKFPKPSFKAFIKWHLITLLLMFLRFLNTFTSKNKKAAFTESMGRFIAWLELFVNKPKIEY